MYSPLRGWHDSLAKKMWKVFSKTENTQNAETARAVIKVYNTVMKGGTDRKTPQAVQGRNPRIQTIKIITHRYINIVITSQRL